MPADPTSQNALIVIAIALSIQTLLMVCTVIAMAVAWKRAHNMLDTQLGHFSARLDDVVSQTRLAVGTLERSAAHVNSVLVDTGNIMRTVTMAIGAPRAWLMAGAATAARALARWRRSRNNQHQQQRATPPQWRRDQEDAHVRGSAR
jgi:hypothetical protein